MENYQYSSSLNTVHCKGRTPMATYVIGCPYWFIHYSEILNVHTVLFVGSSTTYTTI